MFPLKDNIPARQFPIVNTWIIVINILIFLYELQMGPQLESFLIEWGFTPARFFERQLANFFDFSRFYTVFSSMFLHGSLFHVLSNMWMLWIFGDNVEDNMGHGRYLVFYLVCGFLSVFAQGMLSMSSMVPLVGASGAISGVLGAYFVLYPGARVLTLVPIFILFYLVELPAYFFLGLWFLIQAIQGSAHILTSDAEFQGGIAWWAHIGGFAAGFILVNFFRIKKPARKRKW